MKLVTIVGARPQFIKAAIVSRALERAGIAEVLVHTGQHYDAAMSDVFFSELGLRSPDHQLGIGSGGHGAQTGAMLAAIEEVIRDERPDRVLVYGDTNSTLAGALAAAKLHLPVDHVEAGLRSFDRDMPEEVNRVVTDQLADLLFCPTQTGMRNLEREGLAAGARFTGDVMLDLAIAARQAACLNDLPGGVTRGEYFLATIHRPSNVDDPARRLAVVAALARVSRGVAPVVIPVHPRLRAALGSSGATETPLRLIDPVGYLAMQSLILGARGVITDSGGVQKEALFHGVPCLTLRDSTEWTESLEAGLNRLMGENLDGLVEAARECGGAGEVPPAVLAAFGNGEAGPTIAALIGDAGTARARWRR